MERVVCIEDLSKHKHEPTVREFPKVGEIYTVKRIIEKYRLRYYDLLEFHYDAYDVRAFRPICDDGYILCDYLENVDFKQYQLEEAIKQ